MEPQGSFYGTFSLDDQSNTTEVAYIPGWDVAFPPSIVGWEFVPLSLDVNVEADACEPLPADTPDLSQVIPLIRRGGCDFDTKQANLEAFGAKYIMFYNNDQWRDTPWTWEQGNSILGMVDKTAGEAMIATIKAGGNVTGDFSLDPSSHYFGMYNSAGGKANMFTSWGGLNDLTLKPDVAAPGGDIFSTYINDEYAILSGTSMATPYIAGVAALYIGHYGGRSTHGPEFAKKLAMRIMSSGRSVPWWDGLDELKDFGYWAPPIQVGTGLIDATRVLNYDTSLSFAKFSLNDTHHFSRFHEVDVTNNGNETISYRFELQDAAGFTFWMPYDANIPNTPRFKMYWSDEMIPEKIVPVVSFPSGTFSVKPGQTKTAKFSFKYPNYPAGLENIPLYSGKILVISSKGEELSIPYFGVGSDVKDLMAKENFRHEAGWPQCTSGLFYPPFTIDERSNFTFNLTVYSQDFPHMQSRMNWAVRELRWDIFEGDWVERDWKYPPVVGQAGYVGSVASWALADQGYYYFDPATDNENLTISFPLRNLPRSSLDSYNQQHWWMGKLANGSQIGVGEYVMRYATLAPFGVPEHSDNWDTFTHTFSVLPLIETE
ncbi:putative minor extracellular protease vpr protein [Phaeoacremonium minimum UCRPA7]|uniref:Putative minor extracellular protease vpr protein n=1 Tax=Phaeoacremonium minimum (strain UCR-PA7) TaxID=1286976 RepID=R8BB06_PHAM7|nr:putative minor extracellular protease vpr protein [Phaeoacremonium minimum UCRPA7]EON96471.1 putative minor extracellular protease vpr protein [Phaeoacremonium minimum UCRPA7]